ncbi:MAG: hypothetical protein O2880_12665 [Proteobacteria bacterium]|nr:hypothetical protein [Pseudomonadota bacterium]
MREFNVGCTIDNRIEFGACTDEEPNEQELQDPVRLDELERNPDELNRDEEV